MPPKASSGRYKKGQRSGANNGIAKLKNELQELREQVKFEREAATALRAKVTCLEAEMRTRETANKALQAEADAVRCEKGSWKQMLTQLTVEHRRECEKLRRERDKASSEARAAKSILCPPRGWSL